MWSAKSKTRNHVYVPLFSTYAKLLRITDHTGSPGGGHRTSVGSVRFQQPCRAHKLSIILAGTHTQTHWHTDTHITRRTPRAHQYGPHVYTPCRHPHIEHPHFAKRPPLSPRANPIIGLRIGTSYSPVRYAGNSVHSFRLWPDFISQSSASCAIVVCSASGSSSARNAMSSQPLSSKASAY